MGIPGILREIGKGERIALSKLAIEHLEKTQRPLRIAIDAAIWNFQSQSGKGGKNPALRTLYFKLLRLLALPIHPVFVYDGKNKPLVKRGRTVTRWGSCVANETSKKLLQVFRYPHHTAPGEAEAECAHLQKHGIVDMVMSQDGDAIMFGSSATLRDWSKEGSRGSKGPTHVNLLDLPRIKNRTNLDPEGMILVALLSGGDYDQNGVAGFGSKLACEIARAGFGTDLLKIIKEDDVQDLREWRDRLQYELETNESGYFKTKHRSLRIPDEFPDRQLLGYYTNPAVSDTDSLATLEKRLGSVWDSDIDIQELREYVGETFDWQYKPGAWKLVRGMALPLLANRLRRGLAVHDITSVDQIRERRMHFENDGIPELRVIVTPATIVGLDLNAEQDSPEYLARLAQEEDNEDVCEDMALSRTQNELGGIDQLSQSPTKPKRTPPWNPHNPEKMWIAETILQLGVPALVEDWQQAQRDMLADPVKFATRKLTKAKQSTTSKAPSRAHLGTMDKYLTLSKPAATSARTHETSLFNVASQSGQIPAPAPIPKIPTKKVANVGLEASSPSVKQYFKSVKQKPVAEAEVNFAKMAAQHDDDKRHDIPGSSTLSYIVISTSPISEPSTEKSDIYHPTTPRKLQKSASEISSVSETSEVPASVTRRKDRRAKQKLVVHSAEPVHVPEPQRRPIESFFLPVHQMQQDQLAEVTESAVPEVVLPRDLSNGLHAGLIPKALYAVPRASLPGTWKEIDLEDDVVPFRPQRANRVSYVDMAGG